MEPTATMLDEDRFWGIVAKSRKDTETAEEQTKKLVDEIENLSPKGMVGFRLRTDQLLHASYTSEMWCASYILNGGCSDDGFEYFRCWVISLGKQSYYNAKTNPDTLIAQVVIGKDYYEFEDFWYVALTAFENKTGEELYDYLSEDFELCEAYYPAIDFNWEEGKAESMKAICPNLFERLRPQDEN